MSRDRAPNDAGGDLRRGLRPGLGPLHAARPKSPRATLKRLFGYFAPWKAQVAFVSVGTVGYSLLGLAGPYLMGVALDRFIESGDAAGLGKVALLMIGTYVTTSALQAASSWLMANASQRALAGLRRELFGHVQSLPMAFFDRHASGETMSRLTNDIDAINGAVGQNVTTLFASLLSMVGIVVAMFVMDRWLALASLVVVPLMIVFTQRVAVYTRTGFQDLQRDLGALNGVMEETIAAQKVVTMFRRNESVVEAFRRENERAYRSGVRANTYALLLMPLTTVLGNLFVIVLAGLGGFLALRGLVTVGVIAAFIHYSQNFVQPLRQLSNLYNTLQAALAGAERVFEILDTPAEADDGAGDAPSPWRGAVRFEHVTFGYRAEAPVIRDMSFEAEPGKMIALVGPTGAGKTTIANLITRFYDVDAGAIRIDGVDVRTMKKDVLRRSLGLVLQDTYLFGGTILDNIRYGRLDASDEEVFAAARTAEADGFIRQLPGGYATVLSERASNLSQGQRQLLAIARAVLADPAILVLDEATSSVDTRTEARIQRALLRLMKDRTSFVIAHRLSTIRDADQVLVIDDGRIVERGTHEQLLASHGTYQRLYTSQFKGHAL